MILFLKWCTSTGFQTTEITRGTEIGLSQVSPTSYFKALFARFSIDLVFHISAFNTSDYGIRGSENFTGPTKYNNLTDVEAQKDWKESCLFPGFKENQSPYEYSADFYFVWMGRLAFLVLFQVYSTTTFEGKSDIFHLLFRTLCME